MPNNIRLSKSVALAIFASVVLTACGGGGGGSSEPKTTVTPPPPPADTDLKWDDENQKWDESDWQ